MGFLMSKERNSAGCGLWSGDQIFWRSEGPKNRVFGESEKKKIGPTTFDKNLVVYTRVYKLCSNVGVGIFAQSVFEKSQQQVEGRFEWRSGREPSEGVNRYYQSQSGLKDDWQVWTLCVRHKRIREKAWVFQQMETGGEKWELSRQVRIRLCK